MISGANDKVINNLVQNDVNAKKELIMHDFQWMPSLDIKLNKKREEMEEVPEIIKDYFNTKKLDLKMLEDYISIVVNIHERRGTENLHLKYRTRYCSKEEFTRHGIYPRDDFFSERLCPDIPED